VATILQDPANEIVGHNMGFDLAFLRQINLDVPVRMHDTMILAHLHNPLEPTKKLKSLAKKYLNRENVEEAAILHWFATHGMRSEDSRQYMQLPEALVVPYAIADVVMTMELCKFYRAQGAHKSPVYDLECALIPICADICRQGMRIDQAFARSEAERTAQLASEELALLQGTYEIENPGSGPQVAEFIKREIIPQQGLDIKELPKTDGGDLSTDEAALQEYLHPAIDHILNYRELVKMNSTYLLPMINKTDKEGLLHATLNQTGARTGRFSSSNPNVQNIPRGGGCVDVRRGFICRSNEFKLLLVDLSQIELRVLTHYTQDPEMCKALRTRGGDLHAATAQLMFQDTGKMYRSIAKTLNFAVN